MLFVGYDDFIETEDSGPISTAALKVINHYFFNLSSFRRFSKTLDSKKSAAVAIRAHVKRYNALHRSCERSPAQIQTDCLLLIQLSMRFS